MYPIIWMMIWLPRGDWWFQTKYRGMAGGRGRFQLRFLQYGWSSFKKKILAQGIQGLLIFSDFVYVSVCVSGWLKIERLSPLLQQNPILDLKATASFSMNTSKTEGYNTCSNSMFHLTRECMNVQLSYISKARPTRVQYTDTNLWNKDVHGLVVMYELGVFG